MSTGRKDGLLVVEGLAAGYAEAHVLRRVDLALPEGEIACLLGASGSGKSTLLRCIAGFEPVRAGRVAIAGREVSSARSLVPPEQRGIGVVFQDYALFPHLTARANVAFGLRRWARREAEARVEELLAATELGPHADRYPHELSGGQQQRVALARALAPRPALLLLDEPFSNVDRDLARRMQRDLKSFLKAAKTTALMVTHDRDEAFDMADRLGVLIAGELQQWGEPAALYEAPVSGGVAEALGECSLLPATRTADGRVRCELGEFAAPVAEPAGVESGRTLRVVLRPDDVAVAAVGAGAVAAGAVAGSAAVAAAAMVEGVVAEVALRGALVMYSVVLASGREVAVAASRHAPRLAVGARADLRLVAERPVLVP